MKEIERIILDNVLVKDAAKAIEQYVIKARIEVAKKALRNCMEADFQSIEYWERYIAELNKELGGEG